MSDSPHFSETDDVEINLDALTPDTAEEKDDEVEIDLGDLSEEDSAEEPEIDLDLGDDEPAEAQMMTSPVTSASVRLLTMSKTPTRMSLLKLIMLIIRMSLTLPLKSCAVSCPRSSASGTCCTPTPAWRTR